MLNQAVRDPVVNSVAHCWSGNSGPRILSADLDTLMAGVDKMNPDIFGLHHQVGATPVVCEKFEKAVKSSHTVTSLGLTTSGMSHDSAQVYWSNALMTGQPADEPKQKQLRYHCCPTSMRHPATRKGTAPRARTSQAKVSGATKAHVAVSFIRKITCSMSLRVLNIPRAMQTYLGLCHEYPMIGRRRSRECTIHICSPDGNTRHSVRMVAASESHHHRLTKGWREFCADAGMAIGDVVRFQKTDVPGVLSVTIERHKM